MYVSIANKALSAAAAGVMMEILCSEMGSLPIPKPRRNTSLPNLGIAKSHHIVITKSPHSCNMLRLCDGFVVTSLKLCVDFVATLL